MVHTKWRTCYDKTLLHSIHTYNCGGNWKKENPKQEK